MTQRTSGERVEYRSEHQTTESPEVVRPARRTVGVVIPTLNASRTISRCIESIRAQTHPVSETVIVDSFSTDSTVALAKASARVISENCGMAQARLIGARHLKTDLVLNLDSDQLLFPDTIERCLETDTQVVALGETSIGSGLVAFVNRIDRDVVETEWQSNLDPLSGPVRPRLYERQLLTRALEAIPDALMRMKPAPYSEDSLIYLNTGVSARQVGYVPRALVHVEEASLTRYARKWFRYGTTAKVYRGTQFDRLVWHRGRRAALGGRRLLTMPALVLKGVPFFLGYSI